MKILLACLGLLLVVAPSFAGDVYLIDKNRSEARFEVRSLYTTVAGRMRDIGGTINFDPEAPAASSVKFHIVADSVDTGFAELDRHLRSAQFLNAAKFSQITFQSTDIRATPKARVYHVAGELTLHGVTRRMMLSVEVGRVARDPNGAARAAFMARTTINRKDYGMNSNGPLGVTALLVGEEVDLTVRLVASKQAPAEPN